MSNLRVTVKMSCARLKKDFDVEMPIGAAEDFAKRLETKKLAAEQIQEALVALGDKTPDLIVSFRGQSYILANVHASNDSSIGRCINDILQEKIFAVRERGPRTPKATPEPVPPIAE